MVSKFYSRFSLPLLLLALVTLAPLGYYSEMLPNNNNIQAWLPKSSSELSTYKQFQDDFGSEEIVLLAIPEKGEQSKFLDALAGRLERLDSIEACWTPSHFEKLMSDLEVPEEEIDKRLEGLVVSQDGSYAGIVVVPSEKGQGDRNLLVKEIQSELDYCQLQKDDYLLAGSSIVVAELDRLGGSNASKPLFMLTLLVMIIVLYYFLRNWKATLAILAVTLWAISGTMSIIYFLGGEMNFILTVVPIMVLVFTLAVTIHYLNYYRATKDENGNRTGIALSQAWKPCFFATITTVIGLASLGVSEFAPIQSFGYGAAIGCILATIAGLLLTPAVITVFPIEQFETETETENKAVENRSVPQKTVWHWEDYVLNNRGKAIFVSMVLVIGLGIGLKNTSVFIEPLHFLPSNSKVFQDDQNLNEKLTSTDSIEVVVDFDGKDLVFVDKLLQVQKLHKALALHPKVIHTTSTASFFPESLPDRPRQILRLLSKAQAQKEAEQGGYTAENERLWRISLRVTERDTTAQQEVFQELKEMVNIDHPVSFTGISPLLKQAQYEIFEGFWKSFAMAFLIITCVMGIALRSLRTALIAMIPNLTPVLIVFGALGWMNIPIDIGMMMTGSVALGIAVDGTFHYLELYNKHFREKQCRYEAARFALHHAGRPIAQAAIICGLGMLVLTLSNFGPTARFGFLMAALLIAALIGDLILLPSLMSFGKRNEDKAKPPEEQNHIQDDHSENYEPPNILSITQHNTEPAVNHNQPHAETKETTDTDDQQSAVL